MPLKFYRSIMKPINHLTSNLNQACHSFNNIFESLRWKKSIHILEKQNQQEMKTLSNTLIFFWKSNKRCCFFLFLLSKCSRIPLVIQQCVVKETFLLKAKAFKVIVYSDPCTSLPSLSIFLFVPWLPKKRQIKVYEKDSMSFIFPRLTRNRGRWIP